MAATAERISLPRPEHGWLVRALDSKPFLIFLCLLPALGILILFLTYPLGLGVWLAFTDATIGRPGEFVGLDNYIWLFSDPVFLLSVFNTLFYTILATIGKFALGLWLALLFSGWRPNFDVPMPHTKAVMVSSPGHRRWPSPP